MDAAFDHLEVAQRLARHLTERVAGDERLALLPARDRVGHAHHQPSLRQHLQTAGARAREQPLRETERNHEQARAALEAVQLGDQRVGLVGRLGPGERLPAEMDVVAAQAAPHHPVGGDRRVDPAREQHQGAATGPDRKTAPSPEPVERHEQLGLVRVDVQLDVGVGKIDAEPELVDDDRADVSRDVHRADREALLAPARANREGSGLDVTQKLDRGLRGALDRGLDPKRRLHDAQSGNLGGDLEHGC